MRREVYGGGPQIAIVPPLVFACGGRRVHLEYARKLPREAVDRHAVSAGANYGPALVPNLPSGASEH